MLPKFLSSDYPMDKHYFLIPKFVLRIIGFYPETIRTIPVRLWAFFNFVILAYGCYAEAYYGIRNISVNIVVALDALCPVATSLLSLLKMVYIWWYREEFKALIQRIRYLSEQQQSQQKLAHKKKYYVLATRLIALVLFFGFSTSNSYTLRNLLDHLLRQLKGEEFIYDAPFKMSFPEQLLSLPLYPITYLLVHWHGYITVCCFVSADGFFLSFCLYFVVLIKDLEEDLRDLLAVNSIGEHPDERTELQICKVLQNLIDRHNEIVELTRRLSGVMAQIVLAHFVTSSLILCISFIDMLLFSGYGIMVYVIYTCAAGTQLFLYCLGGSLIIESCNDLAGTAFSSHWYAHSIKIQKMVLLLLIRAQRVLVVRAPFFSPSLETLTSIIRFTGSLIALAKSLL